MSHLDVAALLAWCLHHIQCDACQSEGARYDAVRDSFICEADQQLIARFTHLPDNDGSEGSA